MLNRRTMFGVSAAAVAVTALPVVAQPHGLTEMLRQRDAIYHRINTDNSLNDQGRYDLLTHAVDLERGIANAPCRSKADALVKLRSVLREAVDECCIPHIEQSSVIDTLIAFLEGSH